MGRAFQRDREMALRMAIGSGRFRLIRQLLTESAVLGAAGGLLGLVVAEVTIRLFVATKPLHAAPPHGLTINGHAFLFSIAVTSLATLAFGLVPALRVASANIEEALKVGGRGSSAGLGSERLRRAFLVGQLALTVVLLVSAALMIQTLLRLQSEPLGFRSGHVFVANMVLPKSAGSSTVHAFLRDLIQSTRRLPGVQQVATANEPLLSSGPNATFQVQGDQRDTVSESALLVHLITVSSEYLSTLSIPVMQGRSFEEKDVSGSEPVIVINELFAKRWFGSRHAIGQYILVNNRQPWRRVIGVVSNTRSTFYNTLAWQTDAILYLPQTQVAEIELGPVGHNVWAYIRTPGPLSESEFRHEVMRINAGTPVIEFQPLRDIISDATRQPKVRTILLSGFAALTLLLAGMGIYGVISQSVTQRTRELGIRAAVGARPRDLLTLIIGRGLRIAIAGLVLGGIGSLALERLISSLLYGVRPTDPLTIAMAIALFLLVALLASYLPARRALAIDPNVALRSE